MNRHSRHYPLLLLILLITIVSAACAEIHVTTIPQPVASPKLRVYVQPFTTFAATNKRGQGGWDTPHEEFARNQVRQIKRYLSQTGIYEIVTREEVHSALGDQKLTRYLMEQNDWALARKIGAALHADYVMVLERGTNTLLNEKYFFNALINVETGKKFGVQYSFERRGIRGQMKEIILASYRDIFSSARDDLFATAIRKGQRISSPGEKVAVSPVKEREEAQQPTKTKPLNKFASEKAATSSLTMPLEQEQPLTLTPVGKVAQGKTKEPSERKESTPSAAAPARSEDGVVEGKRS